MPTPPAWLSAPARAAWATIVPQMAGVGVLAAVDEFVLSQFVTTLVHWRAAVADVDARGVVLARAGASGQWTEANPSVRVAAALSVELRQLGDRLGLSPAARARLQAPTASLDAGWADEAPASSPAAPHVARGAPSTPSPQEPAR